MSIFREAYSYAVAAVIRVADEHSNPSASNFVELQISNKTRVVLMRNARIRISCIYAMYLHAIAGRLIGSSLVAIRLYHCVYLRPLYWIRLALCEGTQFFYSQIHEIIERIIEKS